MYNISRCTLMIYANYTKFNLFQECKFNSSFEIHCINISIIYLNVYDHLIVHKTH